MGVVLRTALIVAWVGTMSGFANAAPGPCGESCLLDIASQYMDSLTGNDPAGAPFAAHARTTENGVVTPTSEGIWKTARGWLYRHTFVDPVSGEIGAFGTVRETGAQDAMVALRLKVTGRKIVESELLVSRTGDFALFEPRWTTDAKPIFTSFIPQDRRQSRAELEAVPRHYFEAIVHGDPSRVAVHPDANRVENGVQTTNSPTLQTPSTAEGLTHFVYMQHYRALRVPVVDPARGLVLAITAFDMPTMTRTLTIRGRPFEINPQKQHLPRTMFLYELFKVEDGRIRAIEAVMRNMPLGADMGWPAPTK
jgi:hypothetical protein